MRAPSRGSWRAPGAADHDGWETRDAAQNSRTVAKNQDLAERNAADATSCEFLKRRYARAIAQCDDAHAEVCRRLLDRVLNGDRR